MAEALMNKKGFPNFTAYSAGSHPSGTVKPEAIRQIELAGLSAHNLRSKSWNEFALPGAPRMDFVFTVCDSAAKEVCPIWPRHPITAHWGVPDPSAATGSPEQLGRAYREAFSILERRISLLLALPLATLDSLAIKAELQNIGERQSEVPRLALGKDNGQSLQNRQ
jgi:arsenate reductase